MPETQSRKHKEEESSSRATKVSRVRTTKPIASTPQPRRSPIRRVVKRELPVVTPLDSTESKGEETKDNEIDELVQKHLTHEKSESRALHRAPKRSLLSAVFGIAVVVGVAILAGLIVLGVGIYRFRWEDSVTLSLTNVLPYPIAVVDTELVRYNEYVADSQTLKRYYEKQTAEGQDFIESASDDDIRQSVKSRMIEEAIIRNIAKDLDVTTSAEDVEAEWTLVTGNGQVSDEEITTTLSELYNWTPAQFKERVIAPYVLRKKVAEALNNDVSYQADVKKEAETVLAEVKKGETSFEDLAKKYSADSTAQNGGDLGFFEEGVMVPEFEAAVKALEVGQTSDIVETQYGYHIIKLEEKVPVKKEEAAEGEEKFSYRARHILITFRSLDDLLTEKRDSLRIYEFL